LARDRRLSHSLEPTLSKRIKDNRAGLDQAISSLWSAFYVGTKWRHHSSPNDRWLCCETQSRQGSAAQRVDLNLLDGCLLIDGKPLGRLPQEITSHPTYARIFGRVCHHHFQSEMKININLTFCSLENFRYHSLRLAWG
jgi:hypothetical protein